MCNEIEDFTQVASAAPRHASGPAIDPIALEPVDEIVITTLVDNTYDALLTSDNRVTRTPFTAGIARAPQFENGTTTVGLMAEHGFSALVSVRRGDHHDDAAVRHRALTRCDGHQRRPTRAGPVPDPGGRTQPRPLRSRRRTGRTGREDAASDRCPWSSTRTSGHAGGWPCPAANPRNSPP